MLEYQDIVSLVKSTKNIVLSSCANYDIVEKGEADFVTNIDLQISKYLQLKLKEIDESISFLSEEDENRQLGDRCWILDPIDGTTNLIYGYNLSSISLALYENGGIVFGVVYNPFNDECFVAQKNHGAYLNGKPIHVSNRDINRSIVEFGAGSTHKDSADTNFDIAKYIFRHCIDIRRICSSALDLCYIAMGRIDGYFETLLKPWDYAAGSLILEEAGGVITDYSLNRIKFDLPSSSIIASNENIHAFLYDAIKRYT